MVEIQKHRIWAVHASVRGPETTPIRIAHKLSRLRVTKSSAQAKTPKPDKPNDGKRKRCIPFFLVEKGWAFLAESGSQPSARHQMPH